MQLHAFVGATKSEQVCKGLSFLPTVAWHNRHRWCAQEGPGRVDNTWPMENSGKCIRTATPIHKKQPLMQVSSVSLLAGPPLGAVKHVVPGAVPQLVDQLGVQVRVAHACRRLPTVAEPEPRLRPIGRQPRPQIDMAEA